MRLPTGVRAAAAILLFAAAATTAFAQEDANQMNLFAFGADQKEALKICDHVYMAKGFGNTFLITTSAGNVLIDTSLSLMAGRHKRLLTAVDARPIDFIILTHGHEDHTGGVRLWRSANTKVIAQRNILEQLAYQDRLKGFFARRNAAQFGGATTIIGAAQESATAGDRTRKLVDIVFDDRYTFKLGELTFELYSAPGETYENLVVWIPELKAAFLGDDYYASFPNITTLRGNMTRRPRDYIRSLDLVLNLKPEYVLPGHGLAIIGAANVRTKLTRYRDAIRYVDDAVVKGMNEGKNVHTLMREIKLPPELNVGEGYGKIEWSVRGIFEGYAGWFDGDPAHMYAEPESTANPDLVTLAGGPDKVAARAKELIALDPVKALHLADAALVAQPDCRAALEARIDAFKALLAKCTNINERGWLSYGIKSTQARLAGTASR